MVSWILIVICFLILAIVFIKFEHHTKRIKLVILLLFIFFVYFSASSIIKSSGIELNSVKGWIDVGGLYFSWLGNIGTNIWNSGAEFKTIVGNVIKVNASESPKDWKINIRK